MSCSCSSVWESGGTGRERPGRIGTSGPCRECYCWWCFETHVETYMFVIAKWRTPFHRPPRDMIAAGGTGYGGGWDDKPTAGAGVASSTGMLGYGSGSGEKGGFDRSTSARKYSNALRSLDHGYGGSYTRNLKLTPSTCNDALRRQFTYRGFQRIILAMQGGRRHNPYRLVRGRPRRRWDQRSRTTSLSPQ